jgi:hypothetical protein
MSSRTVATLDQSEQPSENLQEPLVASRLEDAVMDNAQVPVQNH